MSTLPPNPGGLGQGTACNSERSVSGNSQNSTAKILIDIAQQKNINLIGLTNTKNVLFLNKEKTLIF